jgi:hypothetical protein
MQYPPGHFLAIPSLAVGNVRPFLAALKSGVEFNLSSKCESQVENPTVTLLHVADVGMHDRRERHQSQALREPRIIAQAVPIRCDRQVNECWVAVHDGLIQTVERFVEPVCCSIQKIS